MVLMSSSWVGATEKMKDWAVVLLALVGSAVPSLSPSSPWLERTVQGCTSRYYNQRNTADIGDAVQACSWYNGHLLFVETEEEEIFLRENGMLTETSWLGITKDFFFQEWYWTYGLFPMYSLRANYIPWQNRWSFGDYGVIDDGGWRIAGYGTGSYNVICELESCQSSSIDSHPWTERNESGCITKYYNQMNVASYDDAVTACDWDNLHLLFLETSEEYEFVKRQGLFLSNAGTWLGLTLDSTEWVWTYPNQTSFKAHFLPWTDFQGFSDIRGIVLSGGQWQRRSSMSFYRYNVICEENACPTSSAGTLTNTGNLHITSHGSQFTSTGTNVGSITGMASASGGAAGGELSVSTSTHHTSFNWTSGSCERQSNASDSVSRSVQLEKMNNGIVSYTSLSPAWSLVDCAGRCLLAESCCYIWYDSRDHYCFRLVEKEEVDQPTIDCADHECYRLG